MPRSEHRRLLVAGSFLCQRQLTIAASVCTSVAPPTSRSPLTMPRLTVFWRNPSGVPMAITSSPIRTLAVAPSGMIVGCGTTSDTFKTAMSNAGDVACTRAVVVLPFDRLMVTVDSVPTT